MTEKIYYIDAYIKEFDAEILSVEALDGKFDVILDRTAFFPEEGGQSSDTGLIGGATVSSVFEENGVVHHMTDKHPGVGKVFCRIDFDTRFEKMQCHTAEHILCGIIHRLFGFANVGFHLSDFEVVFDVDGILSRDDIDMVESLANEAVFANQAVVSYFPSKEELAATEYRSKLDISDGVRLVKIGDVDICTCCAPHVLHTGEIGIIKIIDFMKHRGGTRITMVAGRRALTDYRARYDNIKRISGILSAPQLETADTLEVYTKESEIARAQLKQARLRIAELEAEKIPYQENCAVFYLPNFTIPELIVFSNIANKKVGEITVALSGNDGDYKYVISSNTIDLSAKAKDINTALSGRGGGRPEMIQGSFSSTIDVIKEYFK